MFETISNWLGTHESIAIWLEGAALLAIFIWDRIDSHQQHKETLGQLEVSQKQADALINSERAWIMVQLRWEQLERGGRSLRLVRDTHVVNGVAVHGTSACVDCFLSNGGRSPAWIIEKRIAVAISEGENLPPEPDLDLTPVRDVTLEPIAVDGKSVWHAEPGCNGRDEPGKITIIYGSVKYRDIFDKVRETRFGFMVNPSKDLERIPSYPAYNRYT